MLVLNLGCGAPDKRSWHPIDGAINRDPGYDGWRFEDGLGDYADGSVDGVTISHAAMYLPLDQWPALFAEITRVLRDGGVLRITEDATDDTRSRTYPKGWHDMVTLTGAAMVKAHMSAAGLIAHDVGAAETHFASDILIQQQHGDPPHVFFCEGQRMTRILFAPHQDDETLFASFTLLRYRPQVVICYPSGGDYGSTADRIAETREAMTILGGHSIEQWSGGDLVAQMREIDRREKPSLVFACNERASHPDHVAVAHAAREVFGERLRTYHTYDENGRVRSEYPAPYEPEWIHQKLRALCRYPSQSGHPRAGRFFLDDQREYMGQP